jgi:alpha-beta hydrolase superfamily lysophospholipase
MGHKEAKFEGKKNLTLYYQCWLPERRPKAILLIAHGLAEHSGRYKNLADYFVSRGYGVYALDHRGHGKSDGTRIYIDRFDDYITDLRTFHGLIRKENPETKVFLIGHSMGGTIAVAYSIKYQQDLTGLITSGASLTGAVAAPPLLLAMASIASALLPKAGITVLDASAISRDRSVVEAYENDPLVYRGKIPARTGAELARMWRELPPLMPEIKLPVLILHGSSDRLASPQGSKLLYERVSSTDKTLKIYDGLYHEVFNEPEREQVMQDVEQWLARHI